MEIAGMRLCAFRYATVAVTGRSSCDDIFKEKSGQIERKLTMADNGSSAQCNDRTPDIRDGLTREERVVLYVLHETQKERGGRNVPTAMLWGRVCEPTFEFSGTPAKFLATFREFYGPTMNAFDAAAKNERAHDLQRELEELFDRQNKSPREDATIIPATYLRVTVKKH